MSENKYTISKITTQDVEPALKMKLESWLDTYPNEEYGVTREWVIAHNKTRITPKKIDQRIKRFKDSNNEGWVAKMIEI